jgi:hypothetical protein
MNTPQGEQAAQKPQAGKDTRAAAPKAEARAKDKDKGNAKVGARKRSAMQAQKKGLFGRGAATQDARADYLVSMGHAPRIDEGHFGLQLVPAALFAAVVILIVRQYYYFREMTEYFWSGQTAVTPGATNQTEFFSHYKLVLIEVCAVLAILMILYRVITQQFAVKRSHLYIPMLVYVVFVFLSFLFSEYKDVAWGGWNDRFEGTAAILCYFVLLFYIINSVNSERNIKWILYPVAGTSVVLSILGITQATGHDFFQTTLGQKLIVPNMMLENGSMAWDAIDAAAARGERFLSFTFQNNEIYQTVYNINYVSFYLTLLIPVFAMLFIQAQGIVKKSIWGVIFALVVFNMLGSASAGGYLGIFVILVMAVVVLNKRLLQWWRSIVALLAIFVIVGAGATAVVGHFGGQLWYDEIKGAVSNVLALEPEAPADVPGRVDDGAADESLSVSGSAVAAEAPRLDYFSTDGNVLTISLNGNVAKVTVYPNNSLTMQDADGKTLTFTQNPDDAVITIDDSRFAGLTLVPAPDENGTTTYIVVRLANDERQWPFTLTGENNDTLLYRNDLGRMLPLRNVPHFGFKDNPGFGSGRGYIWSASLPLIKDTFFIGHGADTYVLYYPHDDYVGKANAGWNINMIVDKPHNMYIHTAVGTGVISLLALLALFGIYIVQSVRLYWREEYDGFAPYAGLGIVLGITGFLVSGIVDDSTVSTMPMFYGLLGTGIAINMMVKRKRGAKG